MRINSLVLLLLILSILYLSCSGTAPPTYPETEISVVQTGPSNAATKSLWGIWDVYIEPETSMVETVPIRGASFECNVVNFLQPPSAPIQLITVQIDYGASDFPAGKVACDVTIKHPFPGTKFCGFDVLGIAMGNWEGQSFISDPDIVTSFLPNTLLQNADGYTRWWNMPEFTTYGTLLGYIEGARAIPGWVCTHTLNPFKYYSDDLDPFDDFDPDPANRGFFSSANPGINKRRYELQFPLVSGEPFKFKYAVSASWVSPNDGAEPPYEPDDFPTSANMAEAYKVGFIDTISTAYYAGPYDNGGDLKGYIEVRDWQIGGSLPNIAKEIASVTIESPTLFSEPIDADMSGATFAIGDPNIVWIPITIEDVTPGGPENQLLIITVKSGEVTDYAPQIPGISGYEYPDGNLAAYNIVEAPIKDQTVHPDGDDWPMYRRTFDRNGRTGSIGPATDNVVYQWTNPDAGSGIPSAMVFDSMGRVIFRDYAGTLYCVTPDGQTAWSYVIGGWTNLFNSAAVGPDDSVYIGSDEGDVWHIDKNGELIWMCDTDCAEIDGGTAVLDDGSVIVTGEGCVVEVSPDGNIVWEADLGCGWICEGATIDDDGNIYFTSLGERFICLDPSGAVVWNIHLGHDANASPVLGEHGIYFGDQSGNFYCWSYDGGLIWQIDLGDTRIKHCAAIDHDGNIIVGTAQGQTLYCLDPLDGSIIWEFPAYGDLDLCGPIIDGEGKIYIGDFSGWFYCISSEGNLIWVKSLCNNKIKSKSPAISSDGTLVIGDWDGNVWAFHD